MSLGVCRYQTHPMQKLYGRNEESIYLHAEVDAIQNFLRRHDKRFLSSCSLYVARIKGPQGNLVDGLAKPCEGCERCIKHFKINQVFFTKDLEEN